MCLFLPLAGGWEGERGAKLGLGKDSRVCIHIENSQQCGWFAPIAATVSKY